LKRHKNPPASPKRVTNIQSPIQISKKYTIVVLESKLGADLNPPVDGGIKGGLDANLLSETTLSLYKQRYDPEVPLLCMDETAKQLTKETRRTIHSRPGRPERYDYEYERIGIAIRK
jgi:hypothetical protein